MTQQTPAIPFISQSGATSAIRVVAQYPHLGTIVRGDLHEIPNLRARERCMLATFRPLRRKVLTCHDLTVKERADLLRSRVYPRYLHQAGLWRLATAAEQRIALEAIRKVNRSAYRPLTGQSSKGVSNEIIATELGLPTAEDLFDVERTRVLSELVKAADAYTWQSFCEDSVWMQQAVASALRVLRFGAPSWLDVTGCEFDAVVDAIRRFPDRIRHACKTFLPSRIQARSKHLANHRPVAPRVKSIVVSDTDEDVPLELLAGRRTCEVCGVSFCTKQQLAVHRARAHKLLAAHTAVVVGTTCQVCLKEYWTSSRLQAHFKKMPFCQHVYFHADLDVETDRGPHRSDPSRAWRPVMAVQGPRPFWATLQPEED